MWEAERKIDEYSRAQKTDFLKESIRWMNKNGFTHFRDMECDESQWEILSNFKSNPNLIFHVDCNFNFNRLEELEKKIQFVSSLKKEKLTNLRVAGIKFFIDGALGSEGALLSQNYSNTTKSGFSLWKKEEVKFILETIWRAHVPVAVHCIGDLASQLVIDCAHDLKSEMNLTGELNLEHCEVMNSRALSKINGLNVISHMQPCHWLSDKKWLRTKLGDLFRGVFPWTELEKNGARVYFGSDTPIESPNLFANKKAVEELKDERIMPPNQDWWKYHSHPDENWGSNFLTEVDLDSNEAQIVTRVS